MELPRLYPILDSSFWPDANALCAAAEEFVSAGATVLQYRNKSGNARRMLEHAESLKGLLGSRLKLIIKLIITAILRMTGTQLSRIVEEYRNV